MRLLRALLIVPVLVVPVSQVTTAEAAPLAPAPLAPPNGASVTLPFAISWSAASDPSGILAYNWQVSTTSSFAKVVRQDSVMAPTTQGTVSGLAVGTYFWRVQAVSNDFVSSAFSAPRTFSVTGAGPGVPARPVLNQPRGGNSFHPWESFGMSWSAAQSAVKYVLEASKDPAFPANGVVFRFESPTPSTEVLITTVDRGNYSARVFAVDANGNYSMPSNVVAFSIAFNAPIAAPPTLVSPTGGASVSLPITFVWNHVINPQSSAYHLQISRNSSFTQIEQDIPFLNGPSYTVQQLPTAGTKFWRVQSFQGVIDTAGTAAATAYSPVGSFVVTDGPLRVNSITLSRATPASGQEVFVDLQLSKGAPAGGATVNLTSSNPQAAPLPSSVPVPAGVSFVQFRFVTGQVAAPTSATITATIGSQATSQAFTVAPPTLASLLGVPLRQNGGVVSGGIVMLNGQAPPGGAVVSLSSSNAAVRPPATVTVPAGVESEFFSMPTSQVATDTPVTITATWRGVSVQATTTLTPQPRPTSLTLDPTTTSSTSGSFGRVTAEDPRSEDVTFSLTSSRPDLVGVPGTVIVPQFAAAGGFDISSVAVSTRTLVDISVSGGGVTLTATLTLEPVGTPPPPSTTTTTTTSPPTTTTTAPPTPTTTTTASTTTAPPTASDTVTITRLEYGGGQLRVEAGSSRSGAALTAYVTSTGARIGALSGGRLDISWPSNPQNVTVRSSLGGSTSRAVTAK